MKVTLTTAAGQIVADVEISLPFTTSPEVLIWGNRVFIMVSPATYKEAFFYVLPNSHE